MGTKPDMINRAPHYNHGTIEPIDVIEDWRLGFRLGNAVKYISRADHKGTRLDDLKKAEWFLKRERADQQENGFRLAMRRANNSAIGFDAQAVADDWKLSPRLRVIIRLIQYKTYAALCDAVGMIADEIADMEGKTL